MSRVETGTSETGAVGAGLPKTGSPEAGTGGERAEAVPSRRAWHPFTLLRSELAVLFGRWRTWALLGILAAMPVVIGVAVRVETSGAENGQGPAFIAQVTQNGLFLVFTALAATLPVFLPLAVGVVLGDAIAGEANAGTLRYLLVAPAGRTRLLCVKFLAGLVFCLVATGMVMLAALLTGIALFPVGDVTLLSGTSVGFGAALGRALLVAVVVAASLVGLAAIGLFVSTLTSSGIAAMASTVGLIVVVQILDSVPQLHAIQPWLFSHYWVRFSDLLRDPMFFDQVVRNLGLQALYGVVFTTAAWARFTTRDLTA